MKREFAVADHPVWKEIAPEIKPSELNRPFEMDVEALRSLSRVRRAAGVPFRFVSDARDPSQGIGVKNSAHNERPCTAVDLRVHSSFERFAILRAAIQEGYTRIGVYPPNKALEMIKGKGAGSVHLDMSDRLPDEVCWTRY